jgi:hypothetical protein
MTTHPASEALPEDAVARLRQRAWQAYLEESRSSESYEAAEAEAWERLQERLAEIDAELLVAHGAGA